MTLTEIRGIWLTTTASQVFQSRKNIAQAMDLLAETGFNVVFPVVWNQGFTLYPSPTMQKTIGREINPNFAGRNPLEELTAEARRVGLKIIPWFEYGFASSYNADGGLLLKSQPEWSARDSQGKLLKKNGFEWLNALDPQVQEFMLSLILEVVKNYDVDGIQGDDRLPALPSEGGYDQGTINRYRQQFQTEPPLDSKDKNWLKWRADILTDFLARVYQEVKKINPNLLISVSPNIHDWALREYLQDSPTWLERKIVDTIHPQIYRRDFPTYKAIIDRIVKEQFTSETIPRLSPGVLIKLGNYRISTDDLIRSIEYNRQLGIRGEILFFYEGLRENNFELANILRQGLYSQTAKFPTLTDSKPVNLSEEIQINLPSTEKLVSVTENIQVSLPTTDSQPENSQVAVIQTDSQPSQPESTVNLPKPENNQIDLPQNSQVTVIQTDSQPSQPENSQVTVIQTDSQPSQPEPTVNLPKPENNQIDLPQNSQVTVIQTDSPQSQPENSQVTVIQTDSPQSQPESTVNLPKPENNQIDLPQNSQVNSPQPEKNQDSLPQSIPEKPKNSLNIFRLLLSLIQKIIQILRKS